MSRADIQSMCAELSLMRRGGTLDDPKPHKLLMVLSVLDLMDSGDLRENQIRFAEPLIRRFVANFRSFAGADDHCQAGPPFFHLKNSTFWRHRVKPGREEAYSKVKRVGGSTQLITDNIECACFDDDLFAVLQQSDQRTILRQRIVQMLEQERGSYRGETERLSVAFHESFPLSRPAIASLLRVRAGTSVERDVAKVFRDAIREQTSLGPNYIRAMPRWAVGAGLLNASYGFTPLGDVVSRSDPDLARPETLWAMHYHLSAPTGPGPAFWHALVSAQPARWLWPGRIPLGAVTLVEGRPGCNKSTLLYDLAARVSTDRPMPGDQPVQVTGGSALLFQGEDPAARIRRQIEAAGGEMDRVFIYVEDQDGPADDRVSLPDGLEFVRSQIKTHKARLVVFDPLSSFIRGTINSDRAVRRALDPLNRIAEETEAAIVLVRHLRKRGGTDAMYAGAGSIAVLGAARSALLVAQHPVDPALRVIAPFKSSFGKTSPSMIFMPTGEGDAVHIIWRSGTSDLTSGNLIDLGSADDVSALREAMYFLLDTLETGPRPVKDVKQDAAAADIAERTLRRAREKLKLVVSREGFGGQVSWRLPDKSEMVARLRELRQRPALEQLQQPKRRRIEYLD